MVCHKNDIRDDNRKENLFIGTARDNVLDMWSKGRAKMPKNRTGNISNNKLNRMDVFVIRFYYSIGIRSKEMIPFF